MNITDKEKKFIELKAQGLKMRDIAKAMYMSYRTCENFASDLYRKTGTANGSSLIDWGYNNGILKINAEISPDEIKKAG
jgi:DNA-binding NarL/FixJ family response regulator